MKQRIQGLRAAGRLWMIVSGGWGRCLGIGGALTWRGSQARRWRRSVRTIERKRSESLGQISCSDRSTWVMSRAGSRWAQRFLWMVGVFGTIRRVGGH